MDEHTRVHGEISIDILKVWVRDLDFKDSPLNCGSGDWKWVLEAVDHACDIIKTMTEMETPVESEDWRKGEKGRELVICV